MTEQADHNKRIVFRLIEAISRGKHHGVRRVVHLEGSGQGPRVGGSLMAWVPRHDAVQLLKAPSRLFLGLYVLFALFPFCCHLVSAELCLRSSRATTTLLPPVARMPAKTGPIAQSCSVMSKSFHVRIAPDDHHGVLTRRSRRKRYERVQISPTRDSKPRCAPRH